MGLLPVKPSAGFVGFTKICNQKGCLYLALQAKRAWARYALNIEMRGRNRMKLQKVDRSAWLLEPQVALVEARRAFLARGVGLAGAVALTACGGGDDEVLPQVRFVNGTVDTPSADFLAKGNRLAAGLANGGTVSSWYGIASGATQLEFRVANANGSRISESRSLVQNTSTSVVAYGTFSGGQTFKYFEESNPMPDAGVTQFRVFQGNPAYGALDVYISNAASLSGLNPTVSLSGYNTTSAYLNLAAGTYRVRITAKGDAANLLYDYPQAVFTSRTTVALAVLARANGSLPSLTALVEKAAGSIWANALSG
jgi:Domain of unknown function (DUF4397)